MAYFGAGAGAGAGGSDRFRWTWTTPDEHDSGAGRRVRGVTQNHDADDALAANQGQLLPIAFDQRGGTWHAVGRHAGVYTSLLWSRVRNTVPFYFRKWEEVPSYYKDEILAHMRRYFDLGPYLDRRELDPIRINVEKGFKADCAKAYRDAKTRFKDYWYSRYLNRGLSINQIRQLPPPGMPEEMWNEHVDFFSGEPRQRITEINAQNRQQMPYQSRQGRINGVRRRHEIYEATGDYPPIIDHWLSMHVDRQGNYINDLVEQQHGQMIGLWEQVLAGDLHMNEDQILDQVLHERPGHRKGRGRMWAGNSDMEPQPEPQPSPQFGTPSPFSDFSPKPGQGSGANYYVPMEEVAILQRMIISADKIECVIRKKRGFSIKRSNLIV